LKGLNKLNNGEPFGGKIAKKFNIGDLVYWQEWGRDLTGAITRVFHYGMLINILHKELGEREVVFASILPLNQKEVIEVSINKIRKLETN